MKCERCGHELDNDDLFCSKCGKAVFEEYMDEDDIWEFYKSDEELKAMKKEAAAAKDSGSEKEPPEAEKKTVSEHKGDVPNTGEDEPFNAEHRANGSSSAESATDGYKTADDSGAEPVIAGQRGEDSSDAEPVSAGRRTEDNSGTESVSTDHRAADNKNKSVSPGYEAEDHQAEDFVKADHEDVDPADTDELPFEDILTQASKATADKTKKEKYRGEPEKKNPIWLISGCILLVCLLIGILWGVRTMQQMDEEKKAYYAKTEQQDKTAGAQAQNTENKHCLLYTSDAADEL